MAEETSDADEVAAIEALVSRYIDCFNAADFRAALECYRLPFSWYFGSHAVTVSSEAEFLETMERTKAGLKEQGLSASSLHSVTVRMLGRSLALAGVVVSRNDRDGGQLALLGGSYLVHKGRDGWRLAANGTHPVEAVVPPV